MGVTGEPTIPGRRRGGAVSRKRLRSCSRSQVASSSRYHISPSGTPSSNRQRWWIGRNEWRLGSLFLPRGAPAAELSDTRAAICGAAIHSSSAGAGGAGDEERGENLRGAGVGATARVWGGEARG